MAAMAFFGARRFGLIGGRPAAADRRPEAFAADLVVSHPLKVIALNVWLITALSVLCGNQPVCRVRGIDTATPSSRRRVDGVEVIDAPRHLISTQVKTPAASRAALVKRCA